MTAVRIHPDFTSWQQRARQLLLDEVPPQRVWWQADETQSRAIATAGNANIRVPKPFLTQARAASCHRNGDRWALLYHLLWRMTHGEHHLMALSSDPLVVQLHYYAKAVSRDVHKMKAFVRFRAVDGADGDPRYIAWFEPDHYIVEYAAPFFQRRFANMCWSILTPDCCAHWEGRGEVWFSAGADKAAAPGDDLVEETWRCYYRSIFNPARVKIQAMLSEMPQKYWKNLPEARLIPELVRESGNRVDTMTNEVKTAEQLRCGPRPAAPEQTLNDAIQHSEPGSIQQLALAAQKCRNCPLWQPATQTVFGAGPVPAPIMLIGEQPGDQEDLTGKPFVGPAGALLNHALTAAGLRRDELYITNTVKHFKFRARGKRRLHERPREEEIQACAPWLAAEIDQVQPDIIVCLGATAAQAQLGQGMQVTRDRGKVITRQGRHYLITVHPAYLLRNGESPHDLERFVADLQVAARHLQLLRSP
ncbi:hypothetical protein BG841_14445 [Marinobacter sp. X15-166B]|nr:hypothetical protein BG841_14445 [Marinobacter sp. X15-166B]